MFTNTYMYYDMSNILAHYITHDIYIMMHMYKQHICIRMHTCVCMYVYIYIYMHIYIYMYMYIHIDVYIHASLSLSIYIYIHRCMHICIPTVGRACGGRYAVELMGQTTLIYGHHSRAQGKRAGHVHTAGTISITMIMIL